MTVASDQPTPRVWVLRDQRPGNVSQVLGVAERLGWPFEIKPTVYGPWARLPNWLVGGALIGLTPVARTALAPPLPDIVIAAGRRAAPVVRWLKRRNPAMLAVQLMWPGAATDLDLVAVPEHDLPADDPRILPTLGAAHRVTAATLRDARVAFAATLTCRPDSLPRPWIACLVGGARRHYRFAPQDARTLAEQIGALARARGGSLLVSTSRRTGAPCTAALATALDAPHRLYPWTATGANPYLGVLAHADAVVVTADSVSMATEACATGVPVFVFHPGRSLPAKLKRFHDRLAALGYLRPLGAAWPARVPAPYNPADTIATAIRERYANRAHPSP